MIDPPPADLLSHLQRQLEAIYDLEPGDPVSAFLIDRQGVESWGGRVSADEEVFLVQRDGVLELGLYLAPELLDRLRGRNPAGRSGLGLVTEELSAFTTVAEGVSHVVYLLRCAAADRQVTKLELEAQAEVDKFAVAALHLWGRGLRERIGVLWSRLFEGVGYHAHLATEDRDRYVQANAVARNYARYLEQRYVRQGLLDGFLRDLRETYRLLAGEKLRVFETC